MACLQGMASQAKGEQSAYLHQPLAEAGERASKQPRLGVQSHPQLLTWQAIYRRRQQSLCAKSAGSHWVYLLYRHVHCKSKIKKVRKDSKRIIRRFTVSEHRHIIVNVLSCILLIAFSLLLI